jgi:hypothetical protein
MASSQYNIIVFRPNNITSPVLVVLRYLPVQKIFVNVTLAYSKDTSTAHQQICIRSMFAREPLYILSFRIRSRYRPNVCSYFIRFLFFRLFLTTDSCVCLFVRSLYIGRNGIGVFANFITLHNLSQKVIFKSTLLFGRINVDDISISFQIIMNVQG